MTPEELIKLLLKWKSLSADKKSDVILTVGSFIPGLDAGVDLIDLGRSVKNREWGNASFAMLGLGLPFSSHGLRKILSSVDKLRNRKLRMTHVTTMSDIQNSISKGDRSLITPSFSIYKDNGQNLFMYNKENHPVVFIGNREILSDPNYIQMKGDQGVPMLDNTFDFTKRNSDIAKLYVDNFGLEIKDRGYAFNDTRKNLNRVNYNEGKYLGELPYNKFSYVIGPDTEDFKEVFKDQPYITYPTDWMNLDRSTLRSNLLKLVENTYKQDKNIILKQGGQLTSKL